MQLRPGSVAQVGFFEAFHFEKFERNNGEKHVYVDVRDDGFAAEWDETWEIARAEQAFLRSDKQERQLSVSICRMRLKVCATSSTRGAAEPSSMAAVINAVAVDWLADASDRVRGEDDVFIFQKRVAPGSFCNRFADSTSVVSTAT